MTNSTKFYCLFLLFFIFSCHTKTDVLLDKNHIDTLSENKREKYLDSIVNLLNIKSNDSVVRDLYLKISSEYYYINNSKKSLEVSLKSFHLSKQAKDSVRMAKSLYHIGDCYENSKKDSAYFYYLQAQKIYTKISDYDNVGRMLFNKAHVLFYDGNFIECEVEISKALQYLK